MKKFAVAGLLLIVVAAAAAATETENNIVRILPAPDKVNIDGRPNDWDLSGGVFVCGNVENLRDEFSSWLHLMYDDHYLYVLARVKDKHPLVNSRGANAPAENKRDPRQIHGDSLTMRIIANHGKPGEVVSHITLRQGKDNADIMGLSYGVLSNEGKIEDLQKVAARQAFLENADGKGYTHEIRIPLILLKDKQWRDANTRDAGSLGALQKAAGAFKAGDGLTLTVKQSFSWSYATKDIFKAGVTPDRTFTDRATNCWGLATFETKGRVAPQHVRLSNGREFPVALNNGALAIDWTGLEDGTGFKPITFTMPEDGYVSLNIKNADGVVVRQLLTANETAKGEQTVAWDGLTTPAWTTPGAAVEPGEYTWSAIWHKGIGLRLRGWAYHGPSDPWDNGPTAYWGGDHALPVDCVADDDKVYLAWAGAEAGKAVVACGLDDDVRWAAGYHFNGVIRMALDGDMLYYVNGADLKRVSIENGKPVNWPGTNSGTLEMATFWGDQQGMPSRLNHNTEGMASWNGKLFFSFSTWWFEKRDITNWRSLLAQIYAGSQPGPAENPVSKAIWDKLDDRCRQLIPRYLKVEISEKETFRKPGYNISDVQSVTIKALAGLLNDKTLVKGAEEMPDDARRQANRRLIEKMYPDTIITANTDFVAVVDAKTGKLLKMMELPSPGKMVAVDENTIYIFSERNKLLALNPNTGDTRVVLTGLENNGALTVGDDGDIYVAISRPDNQIRVYSPDGKLLRTIAKKAGRQTKGPWDPDTLSAPWGMVIDARGRLWVAETDLVPKRFSIWNPKTGEFIKEYLGPTHYGGGGAISLRDPNVMTGEGCEFRIDPKTGRATFVGIVTQDVFHGITRFCEGANGKEYFAGTFAGRMWGASAPTQIRIRERLGEAKYALRATIMATKGKTFFWADENGDEKEQPQEVASLPMLLQVGGYGGGTGNPWSINMNTDLTFYGGHQEKGVQIKVGGFTKCGAPKYDLENIKELPPISGGALSSPDNRLVVSCDAGAKLFRCYEVGTGKLLWTYPNRWHGVHGSHRAPGPAVGLIRGAYGFVGNAELPKPIGAFWVINSNVGEWHVLTEDGYYLTRLFQGDSNKHEWPKEAVPGAVLDNVPSGRGGEDFGGSMIQGKDGKIYIEAGKLALWNVEVVGLENVKEIKGGKVTITAGDTLRAEIIRGRGLQTVAEAKSTTVKKLAPKFTGKINNDFKGAKIVSYNK
ncbi:MAG: PQQ-binding-like beta-propeller repeat protein, partial [Planctomycetes bacterium]|nr:PQQ-binding-like beta-propeller repeat protein [Planctomycetota bacterium]